MKSCCKQKLFMYWEYAYFIFVFMAAPTPQSRDSAVEELEVALNSLTASGNQYFSKMYIFTICLI